MKIALFTLTRDRLFYTQHCFQVLHEKAGYPFDHFVIDNASTDGTVEWLKENSRQFAQVRFNFVNAGCCGGYNQAVNMIAAHGGYDLFMKFDNDCEIVTPDVLLHMVGIFETIQRDHLGLWLLSPHVEGIFHQPQRFEKIMIGEYHIGETCLVGGLFQLMPFPPCEQFRLPSENVSMISGQDSRLCTWFRGTANGKTGYVEDLVVNHFEGTFAQAKRYPEYHARKWCEHDAYKGQKV